MAENAVAVKLPEFWPELPRLWFATAEAQFEVAQITQDNTKYSHVVKVLGQKTAKSIVDLLENPPDTNRYDTLKQQLTAKYQLTDTERAQRMLELTSSDLGDGTVSDLVDKLMVLRGSGDLEFLFRHMILRTLEPSIQQALLDSTEQDYRKLAKRADHLRLALPQQVLTSATSRAPQAKKESNQSQSQACWYHRQYGSEAKKCNGKPCPFSENQGNDSAGHQ